MTQTGGASLAAGLLNMAAMKIVAVVLGPSQVALLTTLQQLRLTALTAATLNGQTALIQGTAAGGGPRYVRTALLLMTAAALLTAIAMLVLAPGIGNYVGTEARLVRWLALPVTLGAAFVFVTGLLNARGAIASLAKIQLAAPAATALLSWPVAQAGGGLLWIVLLAAPMAVALGCAAWPLRGGLRASLARSTWFHPPSARRFFSISGALLLTGLATTGSLLTVRAQILAAEGPATTGHFDAAWAISMSQAALVLASLQTYYLPALARTPSAAARSSEIRRVLVLACGAATAIITLLAALKPLVLTVLYSTEFTPAARYLRWTLLGDYCKVTSWILSVPLVATADLRAFIGADLAAYAVFLTGAAVLSRFTGAAEAASIAFAAMYAVHLLLCGARLYFAHGFRPGVRTSLAWMLGLAAITATSALFWNA